MIVYSARVVYSIILYSVMYNYYNYPLAIYINTIPTDQQPTLPELLRFHSKAQGCIISIIDEIGADYQLFGILLLKDKTGARVRALIKQNREDCDAINLEIVERWLQGGGEPVCWRTLIGILKAVNLTVLARDITDTLSEA